MSKSINSIEDVPCNSIPKSNIPSLLKQVGDFLVHSVDQAQVLKTKQIIGVNQPILVLSVMCEDNSDKKIRHWLIKQENGLFGIEEASFESIREMIDFFVNNDESITYDDSVFLKNYIVDSSPKKSPEPISQSKLSQDSLSSPTSINEPIPLRWYDGSISSGIDSKSSLDIADADSLSLCPFAIREIGSNSDTLCDVSDFHSNEHAISIQTASPIEKDNEDAQLPRSDHPTVSDDNVTLAMLFRTKSESSSLGSSSSSNIISSSMKLASDKSEDQTTSSSSYFESGFDKLSFSLSSNCKMSSNIANDLLSSNFSRNISSPNVSSHIEKNGNNVVKSCPCFSIAKQVSDLFSASQCSSCGCNFNKCSSFEIRGAALHATHFYEFVDLYSDSNLNRGSSTLSKVVLAAEAMFEDYKKLLAKNNTNKANESHA